MPSLLRLVGLVPWIAIAACGGIGTTSGDAGAGADSATATGGASCSTDPECNASATLSALQGKCTSGVCVCNTDVAVAPNGKCGALDGSTPSNCEARGGKCFGLGDGPPPPPTYRPANPGEATCGSYAGTNGGTDTGCFFLK